MEDKCNKTIYRVGKMQLGLFERPQSIRQKGNRNTWTRLYEEVLDTYKWQLWTQNMWDYKPFLLNDWGTKQDIESKTCKNFTGK